MRRANLIPKFDEPHTTATGQTYDVGDYERRLDKALEAADYAALRAEQAARRASRRRQAAGHRREHLRGDHRRRAAASARTAKIEVPDDGGPSSTRARRRTGRAT